MAKPSVVVLLFSILTVRAHTYSYSHPHHHKGQKVKAETNMPSNSRCGLKRQIESPCSLTPPTSIMFVLVMALVRRHVPSSAVQCSSRTGTGRNIAFWAESIVTDMLFSDGTEGGLAAEKTALMLADTCRCLLVLIALLLTRGVCLGSVDEKQTPDHFIEFSPSPSRLIRPPALSKSVSIDINMDIGRAAKNPLALSKAPRPCNGGSRGSDIAPALTGSTVAQCSPGAS
ncbi:hypothetical protein CI102_3689 [Trichoderma harzianum]|nr:hypothetical protein CI102_3689 [Trichoderma harzianum]